MGVVDSFAEVINIAETTAKKAEGKRSLLSIPFVIHYPSFLLSSF